MKVDKKKFYEILKKIYGNVEKEYKVYCPTNLKMYKNHKAEESLTRIYQELVSHRGFNNFIGVKNISGCDFYIPKHNLIIEIDERQHFSIPRSLTFKNYPEELNVGFSKNDWSDLCFKINARDNDPPHRDEQRAWYDTLRDFLPLISGLNPTIRFTNNDSFLINIDISDKNHLASLENKIEVLSKGVK